MILNERRYIFDLTRKDLAELAAGWGYGGFHARLIWNYLYRERVQSFAGMVELRPGLRRLLMVNTQLHQLQTISQAASNDSFTRKYLLACADGQTIETVLMRFEGRDGQERSTACVSTQVGCAMGCVFCATGQMGFSRHLSPGEIVAQILFLNEILSADGKRLRNVVFMGMGEPLHNYEATMTAISILTDHHGLAIAPKHITISTVGVVPGILRLAKEKVPVRLAVSLHGATDEARQKLIPLARRWPLAELMSACRTYISQRKRRIFFEWTLIAGQNDMKEQAAALGQLLSGLDAHVNLIPLNPTAGYPGDGSGNSAAKEFQATLAQYGVPSTIRQRRGMDIAAGCGQLHQSIGHAHQSIKSIHES